MPTRYYNICKSIVRHFVRFRLIVTFRPGVMQLRWSHGWSIPRYRRHVIVAGRAWNPLYNVNYLQQVQATVFMRSYCLRVRVYLQASRTRYLQCAPAWSRKPSFLEGGGGRRKKKSSSRVVRFSRDFRKIRTDGNWVERQLVTIKTITHKCKKKTFERLRTSQKLRAIFFVHAQRPDSSKKKRKKRKLFDCPVSLTSQWIRDKDIMQDKVKVCVYLPYNVSHLP